RGPGDRGGGHPAGPGRSPSDGVSLARGGGMADPRGADTPPPAGPALERPPRQDRPRALPHLVLAARQEPPPGRAPQPRPPPPAAPRGPRDRRRHVHASLADRRAVLHGPGHTALADSDPRREARRPAPPRGALGAPVAGRVRPVRPTPPRRHGRRPVGR